VRLRPLVPARRAVLWSRGGRRLPRDRGLCRARGAQAAPALSCPLSVPFPCACPGLPLPRHAAGAGTRLHLGGRGGRVVARRGAICFARQRAAAMEKWRAKPLPPLPTPLAHAPASEPRGARTRRACRVIFRPRPRPICLRASSGPQARPTSRPRPRARSRKSPRPPRCWSRRCCRQARRGAALPPRTHPTPSLSRHMTSA
jgi:hypothetical protein